MWERATALAAINHRKLYEKKKQRTYSKNVAEKIKSDNFIRVNIRERNNNFSNHNNLGHQ